LTLYDAWNSGAEIEMPDVDCLGILHDVDGDWQTYRSPVPDTQHDALYARIARLFRLVRDQRALRHALAQTYLAGEALLLDAYPPHRDRLHALWDRCASDPARLAQQLPAAGDTDAWLEREGKIVDSQTELWSGGQARLQALREGAVQVRSTLLFVLGQLGVLPR
jgi:hypothetical protein